MHAGPSPPRNVMGFLCLFVGWNIPSNVIGDITGYDINFVVPGAPDVLVTETGTQTYYSIPSNLLGSNKSKVTVQVHI